MNKNNIFFYKYLGSGMINPDNCHFEVVERKFRGHPDSLADMVAQSFMQKYILSAWLNFPEFKNRYFPNFSVDKVVLSGASTKIFNKKNVFIKPVDALLIGKITSQIGNFNINIDKIFNESILDIFNKALGNFDFDGHIVKKVYSASLAGVDHDLGFYNPKSTKDLLRILKKESNANDTVFVVAYSPLSVCEKLAIHLDVFTSLDNFKNNFPEIGSDIKAMIRRRDCNFNITLCFPVIPEKLKNKEEYDFIINKLTKVIKKEIESFLCKNGHDLNNLSVILNINTKDTKDSKYYAVWGTALTKGDIGVVGRGNRAQGFISGIRPSTNEAISGKNPNHFAGILYQVIAEYISNEIFTHAKISNVVYITANNGDDLLNPNSVDIFLETDDSLIKKSIITIVQNIMNAKTIEKIRQDFIRQDVYDRFLNFRIY